MSGEYWDRYGRSKSICHRLDPRTKVLIAFLTVLAGVSIPVDFWPLQGVLATGVFLGHSFARIPLSYVLKRLAVFLPILFFVSFSFPLSQGFTDGWEMMAAVFFRSSLAFVTTLWLVNVLPFDQLLLTLRKLYVPAVLVAMLAFMYRYLFLLWDELDKMRVARQARSFGRESLRFRWHTLMQLMGMLLVRALERAERVHGAMCARGWDGHIRRLDDE